MKQGGIHIIRKSILYRLFGLGKLPKTMVPILEREGIMMSDEGVSGSITLRKFRAPGRYHWYKKAGFAGSIVITDVRFAAFSFSRPVINVPLNDERLSQLDISVPSEGVLEVSFGAAAFHDDWSGSVTCRFRTPHAQAFLEKVQAKTSEAASS